MNHLLLESNAVLCIVCSYIHACKATWRISRTESDIEYAFLKFWITVCIEDFNFVRSDRKSPLTLDLFQDLEETQAVPYYFLLRKLVMSLMLSIATMSL